MADKDFVVKNGIRTVGNTFVANSTDVVLTSNVTISNSSKFVANGSSGTAGNILYSNGTGIYWSSPPTGVDVNAQYTFANTIYFVKNQAIAVNGAISANGSNGSSGQVLVSAGSGNVYWTTPIYVNTAAQYTWTNTQTFSNSIIYNGSVEYDNIMFANGSNGNRGQVLTSNGSSGSPYWTNVISTVGGSNTHVQFNSSALLGGTAGFTFDTSTNNASIANTLFVGSSSVNSSNFSGTANNSLSLGGVAAGNYLTNSGGYTVSGTMTWSGLQTFNANTLFASAIGANGSYGVAGYALLTGGANAGANAYWAPVVSSVSVTSGQLSATYSGANPTLGLATTAVTAGSYTAANITVDAYGRITSAANGSAGGGGTITSVSGTTGRISVTGTTSVTIDLANSGVTAGSFNNVTVDAYGRVTGGSTQSYLTGTGTALTTNNFSTYYTIPTQTSQLTNNSGFITSVPVPTYVSSTSATSTVGSLNSYGDVVAYYSDMRLKKDIHTIPDALMKLNMISGVTFYSNELAAEFGYTGIERQVGVIAQEVQSVLPEVIRRAPFDANEDGSSKSGENYLTVQYDKLVPLLIEAVKELSGKVTDLSKEIDNLKRIGG